jgi:intein/homing endonuclease
VNATIENPRFSGQTKEELSSTQAQFGSRCELSDKFLSKLYKSGIIERAMRVSEFNAAKGLSKLGGKKKVKLNDVEKLEDANRAGGRDSAQCTLILTEGDSAKAMAVDGVSAVNGRDYFGIFPLKGKLLNVKDATPAKIAGNKEISDVMKIVGLQVGKDPKPGDLRYGKIMVLADSDSVSGDTPLLLRKDGQIHIETIDTLSETWTMALTGKEYGSTDFEVWTEKGWTGIRHVMRHKVSKRMFRVLTHTGLVDVTEDHSLITNLGVEIAPKDCVVGAELLHSFPRFEEHRVEIPDGLEHIGLRDGMWSVASQMKIQWYQRYPKQELLGRISAIDAEIHLSLGESPCEIGAEEAYAMGLFWSDGTSGTYKWKYNYKRSDRPRAYDINRTTYSWAIANTNLAFLEKAKSILETLYEYEFKIIEDRHNASTGTRMPLFKLIMNGGSLIRPLVERYTNLFYDKDRNKRVPTQILNASRKIRENFLQGAYDGDGFKGDYTGMDVNGKIGAQCIYYLARSLGYEVSLDCRTDKPTVFQLVWTKGHQQRHPNKIKKIIELGTTEQYVYDLETDNHHFQAGIGQMIVHNTDGSHIKGLVMNLIHSMWPSLVREHHFIVSMLTPVVKATRGEGRKKEERSFYSLADFKSWQAIARGSWNIKYYKGLGTSNSAEAKQYFQEMRLVNYEWTDRSEAALDLAFNKKRADDRKDWLKAYDRTNTLDYAETQVSYDDFVHKDLVHFSDEDCRRSIPHVMDGLKESTRKILYACFKRNLKEEIRVAQLAGYVSEHAAYHHGEASLQGAIINMAQDFVGANNINLLYPSGQFGTRLQAGRDAASPRYIHTRLMNIARSIFIEADEHVLERTLDDDGNPVEPLFYAPIIPMVLVNGALGIGTGFSTSIPCYNPIDVIDSVELVANVLDARGGDSMESLQHVIDSIDLKDLVPWYRGFTGDIYAYKTGFVSRGKFTELDPHTVEVTELPVGTWTDDYKRFLEGLEVAGKYVRDVKYYHSTKTVRFVISLLPAHKVGSFNLVEELGLCSTKGLSVSNFHLYTSAGRIRRYADTTEILRDFCKTRISVYGLRKAFLLKQLRRELHVLAQKIRFVVDVIESRIKVMNERRDVILARMRELDYDMELAPDLIRMPISSLTREQKESLEATVAAKEREVAELEKTTLPQLWKRELAELRAAYGAFMSDFSQDTDDLEEKPKSSHKPARATSKKTTKPLKRR